MWLTDRFSFLAVGVRIALILALVWAAAGMSIPIASAAEAALIGNWKFDETSGSSAADASNYGNTGTVINGTWAAGRVGNALSFNGSSSRVTVPNSASINTITNRLTLAFWANASSLSADWVTALQRSNAANTWFDWQLYLRASDAPTPNRPVFRIDWNQNGSIDTDEQVQGDITLAANTWYHIAVTYDGTAMRFYINGTQRGSTTHASSNIPNSTQAIWMGGNSAWGEYLTGRLDEVYLYNRALSQAEIQALMAGAQYTLTVNVIGSGSVIRNLSQAQYSAGDVVFLRALPANNWIFSGWSGDLSGSANPTSITMNANRVITATFTNAGTAIQWTAYNDVVYDASEANAATDPNGERVHYTAPNVTAYGIGTGFSGSTSGLLRDVTTGVNTPAAVAFTQSGGVAWEADTTSTWNGGYDAALGTDARNTFGGLADMVGTVRYGSSGWYVDLTFTGLNPARRYTFATTASRANNTYTNRLTRYTLSSANSAVNASTTGTNVIDSFNVAFNTGDNHANGYVARWTDIDPGADGTFTIRAQAHDSAAEYRAYAFDVFMLQEIAIGPVQQYTLTVNTVGNGSVTRNPDQTQYNDGSIVQLTAVPESGYMFSGWSGDLTGSTNPASISMTSNKVVTATFGAPTPQHGICEGFETGFTLGQTIGAHADWYDAGAGPAVTAGVGVTGSNGLAAANDIFTWVAHPFSWNDPDLTVASVQMDFRTDASGQFDDDRVGWMTTNTSGASSEFFGVQLDHADGGIVTYWRDTADARIQTPIVPLTGTTATKANTWYRFQAQIAKLTSTSAKIDVTLTELDSGGNPTGTPVTGSVPNTSLWSGGAPDSRYFTASTMWPAYKNYTTAASNADNACFSQVERFAFVVTTDWHTSDVWPNATVADNLQLIRNWIDTPTLDMPAPVFMIVTGDFPNWDQTQSSIDTVLGTGFLWYPVIGNHEVEDNLNNFNTIRDTLVPALPNIVNHGPSGSINTSYSWDYGNAHFVALNAYWDGTTSPGADHAADGNIVPALNTWLDADLTASDQTHEFAFVHEPAFPANRHVGDSLDQYPVNRDAFIATLNAHDVETVFSGHTHFYEHDVAPEYALGDLHQVTNGYLRAYDGATITYVLVNGNCTTFRVYRRLTSAPFALHETWSIGCSAPAQYTLTTQAAGGGSITRNPAQAQYTDGTLVQLTAVPQSGYVFSGWSGDLTGSANPANLTMNSNKAVTATFVTAPPSGPGTRFAAVGDYGDASTSEQNVASLINSWNPEFVITMGDNSYGSTAPVAPAVSTIDHNIGRYYSSYIGAYTGGFGSGSATSRFFPSIGNHDYTDGGGINAYLNYFTLPGAAITTTNTSGNERYYDFVQGPVHFFAINSDANEPNGTSSSSPQAQWLQAQLAASTAPWKIVYFHHPPYSSGSVHGSSAWMQWPFQQWGADAVLAGHDHTYERIVLSDFPYFVNGAGGHGLYTFNTPVAGSVVRYSANYGAMLVEATSITMTFKYYSIASGGTLIDSYTITSTAPTDGNLVPAGSTWRYLDNGSDQGTAWQASAFDDSTWASGAAPLGYGDTMSTTVNCGPSAPDCNSSNYITTYFRRTFNVADPSAFSSLNLRLRRDDGAVVYLNGTEVWRSNMNAGAVSYTTLAPVAVGGADETTFFTTTLPNTLVAGTNVLAVEIHQQAATSSDIGFDLVLTGTLAGPALTTWTAYNDFNGVAGDLNAANVTRYPYTTTGVLKDRTTGVDLTAVLSGTTSGGYDPQTSTNGGPATAGTDSANTFGATGSIIVDQARTIELDATSWSNIVTFSNLDPTKAYTVALTANRNEPTYANARYTRVTIEGADSYTNASTSGVVVYSPASVSFSTGYNTVNGYVARWTNVQPGADGSFSIRSQWDNMQGSGAENTKGYAMSAVMLQQGEVSGLRYTLTTNIVGSGTISQNPNATSYAAGTIVTLTATPGAGYVFNGWSGDLTGSANPTPITMSSNRVVTATFVPGACVPFTENFNSLTLGTRIGQVSGWTESASASPAIVAGGLASTLGLGTGSSIFNWSAHPFTWTNPALNTVAFQMDFQTNASGTFDDDRLAWMTQNTPANSEYNFGIQLDPDTDGTACPTGQNIETYWRNPAFSTTTRVETTIACLPTLTANGWYRAQLLATKLTNTSARLDVTLTALDGSGNPGAVVASGTVTDTSTWSGGAAPAAYFSPSGTSTALYPSYKNHSGTTGNADNAYANLCPVQYTLTVNTVGSGAVTRNPDQAQYTAGTVVTLTAAPNAGYVFSGWSGDLSGSANPTMIIMNGNRVVTATFLAEVTRAMESGWNLLALPLQPTTPLTAQSLLDSLNAQSQASNCTEVDQWLFGGWDSYLDGQGFNDFSIVPGQSYFVTCANPFSWQLQGHTIQTSVPVDLEIGWNLLSVPYPAASYQAQSLLDAVTADGGNCSEIDQWLLGGWDSYLNGQGFNNFSILPDQGYFVQCSTSSTLTP